MIRDVNIDAIPQELKEGKSWVLWNVESRGGKKTKVPYQTNGLRAKSQTPATWCTFDEARAHMDKYSGIGRVITEGFIGIDLDNCLEDSYNTLAPWADELLQILPPTYCEISPSKTGLKLWIKGELPPDSKSKNAKLPNDGAVEVYNSKGRYFTVTGYSLDDCKNVASVDQDTLFAFLSKAELIRKPTVKADPSRVAKVYSSGEDFDKRYRIMCKSRSGDAIQALINGDISSHNNDQSAADMALCNYLAFWFANDASAMDRIVRDSALFRPKWDTKHSSTGSTYGEMTIASAISTTSSVFELDDDTITINLDPPVEEKPKKGKEKKPDNVFDDFTVGEWEDVIPIIDAPEEMDISFLPDGPMKDIINDTHMATGLPNAYTLSLALSAISICMTGSYLIYDTKGFSQPPMLFFCGVGSTGVNKTAPFVRILNKPLTLWEKEKANDSKRIKDQEIYGMLVKKYEALKTKILKASMDGEDVTDYEQQKDKTYTDMTIYQNSMAPTILADDATPEALAVLWTDNRGVIALASDESNILQDVLGRYSKQSNLKPYLSGYDGDMPLKQHRANKESCRFADNASLNIYCVAQPEIIAGFFKQRDLTTSGFFPRFVFVSPVWPLRTEVNIIEREGYDPIIDTRWREFISEILSHSRPLNLPLVDEKIGLKLSSEAFSKWMMNGRKIDQGIDGFGEHSWLGKGDMKGWSAKMASRILRVAGIIHVSQYPNPKNNLIISAETLDIAAKIVWHYAKHAYSLFTSASAAGIEIDAKDLWESIVRKVDSSDQNIIQIHEIKRENRGRFEKGEYVDEILEFLQEKNHLKVTLDKRTGGRPKKVIVINPQALSVF